VVVRSGCAAALVVLAVSAGAAAEQPVRGLTLRVDDHGPGRSGGTVRVLASDPSGAATLAGNPAREGASLTVALVGELWLGTLVWATALWRLALWRSQIAIIRLLRC